jgi:hypothetical protein
MQSPLYRLYKTKLTLLAVTSTALGLVLLILAKWATAEGWQWVADWPITELGSTLFATGLIVVAFEYLDAKDADERGNQRLRKVIRQEAPAIRDAVLDGIAFNAGALKDIASPELLDRIIVNSLGTRLGDQHLANDVYTDLLNQIVRAKERHYDMHVSISLAPWSSGPTTGPGAMFEATIRREYRVTPSSSVLRFACVSDLAEYRALLLDPTATETWYFEPMAGLDAASPAAFELLQLTVNGQPQTFRRSKRADAQTFTAHLEPATDQAERQVVIAYTYRALIQQHGHALYFDVTSPCKGLHVDLAYHGCGIRHVNVLDYIASAQTPRVQHDPKHTATSTVSIGFDGWVFPKSGVAFVWVLEGEMTGTSDYPIR